MSDPYNRRSPLFSVLFVIALILATVEGGVAFRTFDNCDRISSGAKHWQAFPPKWICNGPRGALVGPANPR